MAEPGVTLVHVAARRQGLGEVQRIYRERNPLWTRQTWVIIGVTAVAVLAGAVPDTRWRWPVVLLGPVLGASVVVAYLFLGRVSGVEHRRLIGVSPAGILVYTEDYGSTPLRWEQIASAERDPGRTARFRYVIVERGDDGVDRIGFRDIQDGRSLLRSIAAKRPVPAPVRRRVLVGTAIGAVVALLGWVSFQQAFGVARTDRLPSDLSGFAAVCEEPGTAFTKAAPYAPAAPRPVVIFDQGSGPYWTGPGPWGRDSPAEVQVVMCVRPAGSGEWTRSCRYDLPKTTSVTMDAGRYEVTVYEARTRRLLRVRTLVGTDDECPRVWRSDADQLRTRLAEEQFHESMGDIVGKP